MYGSKGERKASFVCVCRRSRFGRRDGLQWGFAIDSSREGYRGDTIRMARRVVVILM